MPARKPKPPDWLPNWRDASAYPSRLSHAQWVWEFLRRREDYQADFAQYYPETQAYYDVEFCDDPMQREHLRRIARMPNEREKYGVRFLLNPSLDTPPLGFFQITVPFVVGFASQKRFDEYEQAGIRLVAFDLTRPLTPKFANAEVGLKDLQLELYGEPKERKHRQKWATYLRELDADASGASAADMSKILNLAGEANAAKRARDTLQQARLVSDGLTSPLKP